MGEGDSGRPFYRVGLEAAIPQSCTAGGFSAAGHRGARPLDQVFNGTGPRGVPPERRATAPSLRVRRRCRGRRVDPPRDIRVPPGRVPFLRRFQGASGGVAEGAPLEESVIAQWNEAAVLPNVSGLSEVPKSWLRRFSPRRRRVAEPSAGSSLRTQPEAGGRTLGSGTCRLPGKGAARAPLEAAAARMQALVAFCRV